MLSRSWAFVPFAFLVAGCGSDEAAAGPATTSPEGGTTTNPNPNKGDSGTTGTPPDPSTLPAAVGDPCRGTALSADALAPAGLCTRLVYKGSSIQGIRQIAFASNNDLFGQTGDGSIVLLRDANNDGVYTKDEVHAWAKTDGNGNNAHIDEAGGYVYAGSKDGVHRFKYDPSSFTGGPTEKVVVGQPGVGNHPKHTTHVYDGFLYVHSGSQGNASHEGGNPIADYDTTRSLIRRFDLSKLDPAKPFDWLSGEVVTSGLRNANGFKRNELSKKIYAVVNGLDDIHYKGPDVHQDNPGEQVLEIAPGNKYGYPFCFTAQAVLDGANLVAPGTQLVNADFDGNPHDDAWCAANSMKPTTFVQAHSAPLDLTFFDGQPTGNLPEKYRGGAFVAFHGSWDRAKGTHTGRTVVWIPFQADGTSPQPTTAKDGDKLVTTFPYEIVFGPKNDEERTASDGSWSWANAGASDSPRPAGVAISPIDGALYIAADTPGSIYRVGTAR